MRCFVRLTWPPSFTRSSAFLFVSQASRAAFAHHHAAAASLLSLPSVVRHLGAAPVFVQHVHPHNDATHALRRRGLLPPEMQPFVVCIGEREGYKNGVAVRRAVAALHGAVSLVLVGPPMTAEEATEVSAVPVYVASEWLPDFQLAAMLRSATALLHLSNGEGFGLPLVEAMACGCPVIASDLAVSREVAGDAPLFVDQTSPSAIRDAIVALHEHPGVRQAAAARGLRRVEALKHAWAHVGEGLHQLMEGSLE